MKPKEEEEELNVFVKNCERWLTHDLDYGTCNSIMESCIVYKLDELASKFKEKRIEILSLKSDEYIKSLVQQGYITLELMYEVKKHKLKTK